MYLVFLHGLLGDRTDWQNVTEKLPHFPCIRLDLPLHGRQKHYSIDNFEQASAYLSREIQCALGKSPYFLIGYSLGGRLALHYALSGLFPTEHLQGLILEGANLGLQTDKARLERERSDEVWAKRFEQEDIKTVLQDWYHQPVFSHLTDSDRRDLVALRQGNNGVAIAKMLRSTSLAKQPDFRVSLQYLRTVYYLCGEKDVKFRQIAQESGFDVRIVSRAGHNAHKENPDETAEIIHHIVKQHTLSV